MKKTTLLLSILLCLFMAQSVISADDATPNRMLVKKPNGSLKAFDVQRIEEVTFAAVEGRVACDINFVNCTTSSVKFDLTKDEGCTHYLINVMPRVIVKQLEANPSGAEDYLNLYGSPDDDRSGAGFELTGIELNPGGEYAIVTLAFDKYDCAGDVSAAYFTVPSAPLVGDPKVETTIVDRTLNSITAKFVANSDTQGFAAVIGEKGTMDAQYEMFGPMFGFSSFGDMIKGWGMIYEGSSTNTYTWKDLNPNQEYEIFVQAWDVNDTYAPYKVVETSTLSQGGSGASVVTITPGAYKSMQWGDEMLPSQFFKFTPNDQTAAYRFRVDYAADYDAHKDEILADLKSDPEMPMAYWFFYSEIETDYQLNPNTAVVVTAAGKNADGVWGDVTELRYTTPANVSGMPALKRTPSATIESRTAPVADQQKGVARRAPKLTLKMAN